MAGSWEAKDTHQGLHYPSAIPQFPDAPLLLAEQMELMKV